MGLVSLTDFQRRVLDSIKLSVTKSSVWPHARSMRICLLVLTSLLFICVSAFAKTKTLYYGVADETNSPFVEIDYSKGRAEVTGGILKKIADAITNELNLKPDIILLPQKRVGPDLVAGELGLVCFVHESWFPPEMTNRLLWSDDLTSNTNLIATINGKAVSKVEDLFGKQVGVIVNYYYKKMDPYFESGKITKETGPSTASNIQKLLHGRMEYMIISNLEFDYYKKKNPELRSYDLGLDTVKVKCALSKKAGIELSELNRAIAALKKNGVLDKIFKP